jgi:hypothetical protein
MSAQRDNDDAVFYRLAARAWNDNLADGDEVPYHTPPAPFARPEQLKAIRQAAATLRKYAAWLDGGARLISDRLAEAEEAEMAAADVTPIRKPVDLHYHRPDAKPDGIGPDGITYDGPKEPA